MLTTTQLRGFVFFLFLAAAMLVPFTPAHADGGSGVTCPPNVPNCTISVGGGGSSGDGGGGSTGGGASSGNSSTCTMHPVVSSSETKTVPCYRSDLGWFNPSDECYWQLLNPQPKPGDPLLIGSNTPSNWQPGNGAIYNVTCTANGAQLAGGTRWSKNPPPGYGGGPDPAVLAQQVVKQMGLRGADVGIAPKPGSTGLVGLPVWLWDRTSPTTWGPVSASASAAGITVTATAKVTQIVWSMGDGSSVTCSTAGTPYQASYGNRPSPDCGHIYQQTSAGQSGGVFPLQAVSTWSVAWTATTGQTGTITTIRTSNSQVAIGQLQVLNQ
ncbi:MAG: hypothetical protein JO362_01695 [Streptomycetaceae bacterium]|nr:hypothetical protein [Streptomycetaceae bacterium]